MTLPDGFLDAALERAAHWEAAEPQAGIVGFQLRNPDGSRQLSAGDFPTLPGTLAGLLRPRARRKYRSLRGRQPRQVAWVTGCCLLVRRDCLRRLGGLDEAFFLYYEDVDLCRRARAAGWSVWHDPTLRLVHQQPLHGRTVTPALRLCTRHALLTYAARHWPAWQLRLLAGIVRVESWLRGWRARWQGRAAAAELCAATGAMAADLARGRARSARKRLEGVVRRLDEEAEQPRRMASAR
jgi:GT2 family glycosyltransferase